VRLWGEKVVGAWVALRFGFRIGLRGNLAGGRTGDSEESPDGGGMGPRHEEEMN